MQLRLNAKYRPYLLVLLILTFAYSKSVSADLYTAGWIEKAVVYPHEIVLHAKLDTGAQTTSINAPDIEYFDRDGRQWARFRISNKDIETVMIEAPVVRESKIKRHFGNAQKRTVVKLDICIGPVRKTEEVNLVDRTGLNYQLLIGRNFLKDALLIDSGSTYTLSSACLD